jgi:hypothetical protein
MNRIQMRYGEICQNITNAQGEIKILFSMLCGDVSKRIKLTKSNGSAPWCSTHF